MKNAAIAVCGFRSSTGLKVDPKLRPRSPPFELDHRVVSVHGSAARRKPHSRHPEPLELVGKRRCVTVWSGGGSVCRPGIITWYPRNPLTIGPIYAILRDVLTPADAVYAQVVSSALPGTVSRRPPPPGSMHSSASRYSSLESQ